MSRLLGLFAALLTFAASAQTFVVTTTADSGAGSFRQAILDANATCTGTCTIDFTALPALARIEPLTPLPAITWCGDVRFSASPIELSGARLTGPAHGLEVRSNCAQRSFVRMYGITINGFPDDGVRVAPEAGDVFVEIGNARIGTDVLGTTARPNGSRGVAVHAAKAGVMIGGSVISGNARSGFYLTNGATDIAGCRIGVGADGRPLGNGASGVFAYDGFVRVTSSTIAHNGHWGIALNPAAEAVAIDNLEIHSNGAPAIDWGLDGPSFTTEAIGVPNAPVITSASYDGTFTTVRGTITVTQLLGERYSILVYANGVKFYPYAQLMFVREPGTLTWETRIPGDLRGKSLAAISGVARFADLLEAVTSEFGPAFQFE